MGIPQNFTTQDKSSSTTDTSALPCGWCGDCCRFGAIARRVAELAHAYRMKVAVLRRNSKLSQPDLASGLVSKVYSPDQLQQLMADSDYVVVSVPHMPLRRTGL